MSEVLGIPKLIQQLLGMAAKQPVRCRFSGATLATDSLYHIRGRNGTNSWIVKIGGTAALSCRKGGSRRIRVGGLHRWIRLETLHVHENLQMFHRVGRAKFLEQPARELQNDGTLRRIVDEGRKQGLTLAQCLLRAGLRIQRDSQLLVPVRTGNLRASAFTRLDEGGK